MQQLLCVQQLLSEAGLSAQKISLDALDLSPKTLTQIEKSQGIYLVGLKENQTQLLADIRRASHSLPTKRSYSEIEKGHGRIEKRKYDTYSIDNQYFDERWEGADFQTLIQVNRVVYDCKKKTEYNETAFYLSNQALKNTAGCPPEHVELAQAIRGHWKVETNNHIRDITLKEDQQRTSKVEVQKYYLFVEPSLSTF